MKPNFRDLQKTIEKWSCIELNRYLEENWTQLSETERFLCISELAKKACGSEITVSLFIKQASFKNPFYRIKALDYLKEVAGESHRDFFLDVARRDDDDGVRQTALMSLTDLFRAKKDEEILLVAYEVYSNESTTIKLKFAAAATMMYQLGFPHDVSGRPAWWDEDEDLNHPIIQLAVSETKAFLGK